MKCLILSQGPVPTPEHTKVEGGGLRCWGLAKGLRANNADLEITVAYHESYRQKNFTEEYEGIKLATWSMQDVPQLLSGQDSIIVSYCMGELSVVVADNVRSDQQLVLDCYVPIYVEVSARDSEDVMREYTAFHDDVARWAHVLRRGDVFLCASQAQKRYYQGVLSSLGRINPITYGEAFIKVVPYGIYRDAPKATEKPITKLLAGKDKKTHKILWFGGIYPWFDLRNLIDAVVIANEQVPVELVIVGAKNPFNSHPDFIKVYDDLVTYVGAKDERKEHVYFQDWVQFDKRADWYLDSDLVVVVNKLGDENELAWRTRLVDFLWADLPIITNGGDPLGELLISAGAALKFQGLEAKTLSQDLIAALKNPEQIAKLRANLKNMKSQFYWDVVTSDLSIMISEHKKAADLEADAQYTIGVPASHSKIAKVRSMAGKAKMIPAYAQKHGAKNTYYAIRTKMNNRLGRRIGMVRAKPGVIMVAHQLDFSGAPYVFMDLAREVMKDAGDMSVEFHTFNPALTESLSQLNKIGLTPRIHLSKDIELTYTNGDVVVLNTVAHSQVFRNSIYAGLENGTLKKLVWFIHEDEPELLFPGSEIPRLSKLLRQGKVVMFIAAQRALVNYQKTFGTEENILLQPYKYAIPERFHKVRQAAEFNKLSFILPGTMGDGRKGQLPIFYAMADFHRHYYLRDPQTYRDFELVYVGMADDFLSRQIMKHGNLLKGHFKHYGRVTHEKSLELTYASNMTICYSLREALPLFVFEGMAAGHPLLRNDSSGMEEQLFEGKNGFYLDSADYNQVVDTIEVVLNKTKTSNEQLAAMSKKSNEVAELQMHNSYGPMVEVILGKHKQ